MARDFVLVATYLSPGVASGGGGFMIVGGKIVKIPPRGPSYAKLAASLQALSLIQGVAGARELENAAKKSAIDAAAELAGR